MRRKNKSKLDEIINRRIKNLFIYLFAIVIGCWFWSFSFLSDGFENRNTYHAMKDLVVPVSATVTEVNISNSEYYIYIDYSYNGEKIESSFWQTTDTKEYEVGDIVKIKINPEYPMSIFSENDGTSDLITVGIMFTISSSIIAAVSIYYFRKRRCRNE